MVISPPCITEGLANPGATALGKDISNPLIAHNLPKIVWYSTHHIPKSKRVG